MLSTVANQQLAIFIYGSGTEDPLSLAADCCELPNGPSERKSIYIDLPVQAVRPRQ